MTLPTPFVDGFRLTDGTQLNNVTGNPQWSVTQSATATTGGNVNTSFKITDAITNITSAAANSAGVTLPQAVPGKIYIITNQTTKSLVVFALGGSTVDGIAGNIGAPMPADTTFMFMATAVNQWSIFNWNASPVNTTNAILTVPTLYGTTGVEGLRAINLTGSPYIYAVQTQGYYSANDGGQSEYRWVSTATPPADDGGGVIVPIGGGGYWQLFVTHDISVLQFGAKNDPALNGFDSTTAFQNAFNFVFNKNLVQNIFVPTGNYHIYSTLTATLVGLYGDGGAEYSVYTGTSVGSIINYYGTGWCMYLNAPVIFEDLGFVARGDGIIVQNGACVLAGKSRSYKACCFYNFTGVGFQLGDTSIGGAMYFADINGFICENRQFVGQYGIVVDGGGYANTNANLLRNCFVKGSWVYLYDIRGQGNIFIGGDPEIVPLAPAQGQPFIPAGSSYGITKAAYLIRGVNNEFRHPYMEPYYEGVAPTPYKSFLISPTWGNAIFGSGGTVLAGDTITVGPTVGGSVFTFTLTPAPIVPGAKAYDVQLVNGGSTRDNQQQNAKNFYNALVAANVGGLDSNLVGLTFEWDCWATVILTKSTGTVTKTELTTSVSVPGTVNTRIMTLQGIDRLPYGNKIDQTYITNLAYNTYSTVIDNGVSTDVNITPIGYNFPQTIGRKNNYSNLLCNANFLNLDGSGIPDSWLPYVGATPGTVARSTVVTRGAPYSMAMTCTSATGAPLVISNITTYTVGPASVGQQTYAVVTYVGAYGFVIGDRIQISQTNEYYNGLWTVTNVGVNQVEFLLYTWNYTYALNSSPNAPPFVGAGQLNVPNQRYALSCFITPGIAGTFLTQTGQKIPVPRADIVGQSVTVGCWVWSAVPGLGQVSVYTSNGVVYGNGKHSGSSQWEFITASMLNEPGDGGVGILLRTADSAGDRRTGVCYFTEPVVVLGPDISQQPIPRLLDDVDCGVSGRLSWNNPRVLSGTTISAAEGNFYKIANAGPTTMNTISNGRPGQELKLLFTNSNTTVAAGVNIVPDLGAAAPRPQNSVATFIYDGTNWYEIWQK